MRKGYQGYPSILGQIPSYGTIRTTMTPPTLKTIYIPIATALADVRVVVSSIWKDVLQLVQVKDPGVANAAAEGKLLRPALCLLAAGALGETQLSRFSRLAAAYEAMHIASLAHDDVVDHASLRRGQYALNVLWDEHAAVLGGDYLVARALELLLEYECPELIAQALLAVRRMAEGELRYFGKDPHDAAEEDCIALADTKTASLFAAACSSPARLVAPDMAKPLSDFGICLGIAFQLIDDLLDITQPTATLGKPSCGDVAEGKHTLPILFLQRKMSREDQSRLASLRGTALTDEDRGWITDRARDLDIAGMVLERAQSLIDTAIRHLECLPETAYRSSMEDLARFVLVRVS